MSIDTLPVMPGNFTDIFSKYCLKNGQECITKFKNISALEVNFLLHLQSFARNILSSSKLVRPLANSFPFLNCWEAWMTLTRKRL